MTSAVTYPGVTPDPNAPIDPGASTVPTLPDGSPDYTSIGANVSGGSTKVPVDSSGQIDVWNLPTWLKDYEKQTPNPFWWDSTNNAAASTGEAGNLSKKGQQGPTSGNTNNYTSAEEIMKQFAAMAYTDPKSYLALQQALAAGPWKTSMTVNGVFDQNTENALATAMVQYIKTTRSAGVPITFQQYLLQSAQSNAALNGAAGGGAASSRPQLSDPATLTRYAEMAAQAALGRSLSPTELQGFISNFHQAQTDSFNDAMKGQGPVTDKSDPRAGAIQYVVQNYKPEYQQHQTQGYVDAFLNMFLSGQSAAPNVNVDPNAVGY